MRLSADTLAKRTGGLVSSRAVFDHRGWIIRMVCDLEVDLAERSLEWLHRANGSLNVDLARREVFVEGPLSSLKKISDFAFFAGVIGPNTRHDLKKLARMRDRYAHDPHREQLELDPEMSGVLRDTYTYRENTDVLAQSEPWVVLVRVYWQLRECINAGVVE